MVQAATDEYDEWAVDNKGTTECIRAMLVRALKATPPAQPAPVLPVAIVAEVHMSRYTLEWTNGPLPEGTELFGRPAAQPAAQEIVCSTGLCHYKAQRTWNGLTHDEYDAICDKHSAMSDFDFLADIEAKLRSKNEY
jgi:hypothetical protein